MSLIVKAKTVCGSNDYISVGPIKHLFTDKNLSAAAACDFYTTALSCETGANMKSKKENSCTVTEFGGKGFFMSAKKNDEQHITAIGSFAILRQGCRKTPVAGKVNERMGATLSARS